MSRLRVSAISYLNTAPLMWNFEHGPRADALRNEFEVEYTIPSRCAQLLANSEADIGIIPVAAYAAIPDLRILPGIAIASHAAVRSILLVSERPLEQVRSVAVDSSSRTSAALVQVLFAKHFQRNIRFEQANPELDKMLAQHDAALLIGDPALKVDRSLYRTWDLAEEWRKFTGKPFVFAFWAARACAASDEELARVGEIFRESRDAGVKNFQAIAEEWTLRLALPRELIVSYLSKNIHYSLDPEYVEGMELFFRYANELGVLPKPPELHFVPELAGKRG
jgi:Predicted periplasmic solute-binding protein